MSQAGYALGCVWLACVVASMAVLSVVVRQLAVPGWSGPPARLCEIVIGLGALWATMQVLGTVGAFTVGPLVTASLALAVTATANARRSRGSEGPPVVAGPPRPIRGLGLLAPVGVVAVASQWAAHTATTLRDGITHYDTLWYHLPRAARFAQEASFTELHHTRAEFPDAFHPSTSEALNGLGIVLFGHDALTPFLNVAWLGLALLAAWCIGRPFGVAPLSALGAAVLCSTPRMVIDSAGTASNDIAALALLLAAVAILLQGVRTPLQVGVAGLAAGLGLSVKLTLVAPIGLLTVGLVVVTSRVTRARTAAAWLVPMAGAGAYWYIRNWIRTGTPVAGIDLPGTPSPRFVLVDEVGFAVTDYVLDRPVWQEWFLPGLDASFGPGWALLLAVGVTAALVALRAGQLDRLLPVLGVVVVGGAIAYAATPTSALGEPGAPLLFAANLIYLTPALGVSVAIAPVVCSGAPRARTALVSVFGLLAASNLVRTIDPGDRIQIVVALGLAALLCGALLGGRSWLAGGGPGRSLRRLAPIPGALVGCAALVVAVIGGKAIVDAHLRSWYGADLLAAHLGELDGSQRIGLTGDTRQLRLHGRDLAHHVQYLGTEGPHGSYHEIDRCETWRQVLAEGRYRFVVIGGGGLDHPAEDQVRWTAADPFAERLGSDGTRHVFELLPGASARPCP